MEKIRYFKYLFFFLKKSWEGDEHRRYKQSSRGCSDIRPAHRPRQENYSFRTSRKHYSSSDNRGHSNSRHSSRSSYHKSSEDSRQNRSSNYKYSGPSRSSQAQGVSRRDNRGHSNSRHSSRSSYHKSSEDSRQNKSSNYKYSGQSRSSQAQGVSRNGIHSGAKKQTNSFNERDHQSNNSQGSTQNNNARCTFKSLRVKEELKKLFHDGDPKSIMDCVKMLKSKPKENDGFLSAKILPQFEDFFYETIYNFFLKKISDESNQYKKNISEFNDHLVKNFSNEKIISDFKRFWEIISKVLYLNGKCKEFVFNNHHKIISRLSEAYILNLFYNLLDPMYYKRHLFGCCRFSLSYMAYECTVISQSYFFRTEAARVQELFAEFKSITNKSMIDATGHVLIYLESQKCLDEKRDAVKLHEILKILMYYNIENISFPRGFENISFKEAISKEYYLPNINSSTKFIGIISNSHLVFLLKLENGEFYLDRLYKSYLVFLIYAHNDEENEDLRRIISELEKYLDCFPELLLNRKNIVIFKYLFGFYEKELNVKFISVLVKFIDSIVYHIKYSKIDCHGDSANKEYHKILARRTLRFMNKLGRQLQNKFAERKSNYNEFWEAYNKAFSEQSMKILYRKARIPRNEAFKFFEKYPNEALYSLPKFVENFGLAFVMLEDCTYPIPPAFIYHISYDDILDEFWYRFETENYSFDENGNLIFPQKSLNAGGVSSLLKRSHDGMVDSGLSSKIARA